MILTREELISALWQKLQKHHVLRLAKLRERNDSTTDALQTEKLRGRIAEVKRFLAVGIEEITTDDDSQ